MSPADMASYMSAQGLTTYWYKAGGYPDGDWHNVTDQTFYTMEFYSDCNPSTCYPDVSVTYSTPGMKTLYFDIWVNGAITTITVQFFVWPADNASNLGRCKQCETQVGAPINVTNGNVWLQRRDYSLPGARGGLELVRTWNSRWADFDPPSVAGMFGDSWMSTYEEVLTGPDFSNSLRYWRGDGSVWTFTYGNGTYTLLSPLDEHATLVFDTNANQFVMTMADGTRRIFNQPGYLVALVDRNGNTTSLSRDPNTNRLNSVTDAAGQTITFTYNSGGQVSNVSDAVGTIATYGYNTPGGTLAQVTYADSSTLNFVYNSAQPTMIDAVNDTNGKVLEAHTYYPGHMGASSNRALNADSVTVNYGSGQTQISDSMGNNTTYDFQTLGGRNFISGVSGSGCSSCGGRGNQTLNYDSSGNVLSSTDALLNSTSFTYDAMGNVLTRSVQLNSTTTYTWTYTYNLFGEVLTATDPLGNATTNIYDAKGNLTSTTTPPPAGSMAGLTTSFIYDSKGELTQVTDPRGNSTSIAYWPTGLVSSITDAQSNPTAFQYDARGNRTLTTDALGTPTAFLYDNMDRLTDICQGGTSCPGLAQTHFGYDSRGRRNLVQDANGKTTQYGYDDADRLNSVSDAFNPPNVTAYGYDTENHLASITPQGEPPTTFDYSIGPTNPLAVC